MKQPNVLVLRSPGTNCEQETAYAFELAGARTEYVHVNQLLESPGILNQFQILVFPGGFSYGDDIAAGKILASQMNAQLFDQIHEFHERGNLVLGICNGFQVLIKSGFLVPIDDQGLPATLTWNENGRYVDVWVNLKANDERCVFLKGVENMYLPIAHAEGKFVPRSDSILDQLADNNQLALKYCRPDGQNGHVPYPHNPNGSTGHVAGVCNDTGRIFGLMPHPERHIDGTQHPRWTREGIQEKGDGLVIFENAVSYFTA